MDFAVKRCRLIAALGLIVVTALLAADVPAPAAATPSTTRTEKPRTAHRRSHRTHRRRARSSRSRTATAARATTTAASSPGSSVAMPTGDIPGWHQVFADNFTGAMLDRSKWRVYSGQPGGDPGGWFDPNHVSVAGGNLVISGYKDSADGGVWATGGVSSSPGLVQTYGKYLVRFRFDRDPAVAGRRYLAAGDRLQRG
jgi:hypothetical protein